MAQKKATKAATKATPKAGTKAAPGAGARSGVKTGTKTGNAAGTKAGTKAAAKAETRTGTKTGTAASKKTGTTAGTKAATSTTKKARGATAKKAATKASTKTGGTAGTKTATATAKKTSDAAAKKTATKASTRTGGTAGTKTAAPATKKTRSATAKKATTKASTRTSGTAGTKTATAKKAGAPAAKKAATRKAAPKAAAAAGPAGRAGARGAGGAKAGSKAVGKDAAEALSKTETKAGIETAMKAGAASEVPGALEAGTKPGAETKAGAASGVPATFTTGMGAGAGAGDASRGRARGRARAGGAAEPNAGREKAATPAGAKGRAKAAPGDRGRVGAQVVDGGIPGRPAPEAPSLAEPTEPREPLPPKADQSGPETVSPTGQATGIDPARVAQAGAYLTNAQGTRLFDSDHSLKAGPRGPVLLQDHHLREKIMHFDHERIPERVVHARGAAAHGVFQSYGTAESVSKAAFLAGDVETPVFVRFSTVLGSRGSADTVRDTRGFATKFYTDEGVFDLVGNNIPVFFIQDAIKFPDIIHAAKPHPDREIPQAQSAHDTFWDFVSLHTEATHHTLWNMSDRGIPRSYRMMEGFGVHTFRLVNAQGTRTLVKFHWKPKLGVHSLVWEEAQIIAGVDPDFHRRDLFDAIESGAFPQWELGIQTFPDTDDQTFEGIDLLDPTKIVPEELAPVQPVGLLTLNANPSNYFAEVEQVAFHTGHLVPGIDATDDPLLAGRMFSYLDTQLTRLGGPNFGQIPINRTHVPVNDMLRDGMHQTAVHSGVAPYKPNSLDGGCPFFAGADTGAFVEVPVEIPAGRKVREAPASFADHYSQPRQFWLSMTPTERQHIIAAYTFELSKCREEVIRERVLAVLANIDGQLCAKVADGLGLAAPAATERAPDAPASPALSQIGGTWPVDGRVVGIVAGPDADLQGVRAVREAVLGAGMVPLVIAPTAGALGGGGKQPVAVQRTFAAARSVEFDALVFAGVPGAAADAVGARDAEAGLPGPGGTDPRVLLLLAEAYRHGKAIGGWNGSSRILEAVGIREDEPGIAFAGTAAACLDGIVRALSEHRAWDRFPAAGGSDG